jgi:hypothetical protein
MWQNVWHMLAVFAAWILIQPAMDWMKDSDGDRAALDKA